MKGICTQSNTLNKILHPFIFIIFLYLQDKYIHGHSSTGSSNPRAALGEFHQNPGRMCRWLFLKRARKTQGPPLVSPTSSRTTFLIRVTLQVIGMQENDTCARLIKPKVHPWWVFLKPRTKNSLVNSPNAPSLQYVPLYEWHVCKSTTPHLQCMSFHEWHVCKSTLPRL